MTIGTAPVILWFRQDLRLADNPALDHAIKADRPIIPVYILDETSPTLGSASRWWLDKSLRALDGALRDRGSRLILRRGNSESELRRLIEQTGADQLFLNRLFEPEAFIRDADISHSLLDDGVECHGFNGALLTRPGSVLNGSGGTYKVFTPFLKSLLARIEIPPRTFALRPLSTPGELESDGIDDWSLHPAAPDWSCAFDWTPGEAGAGAALSTFLSTGLKTYTRGRDHPAEQGASRLSPHLHWGEIAVGHVLGSVRKAAEDGQVPVFEAEKFVAELVWREFSAHLLNQFPYMTDQAFRPEYDSLPWRSDPGGLKAWQRGRTGYPIVDAGMRQLWATGWMHNRVRMITASFLVKDLLIDWRKGEAWFRETLVDADLANNVQNWQWVAGSGADAAPFFRIFNPVTQGEKFDAKGAYVRRWVPELKDLPDRYIHSPWSAPADVLANAGVEMGQTYPHPVIDHAVARDRALTALKTITARRHELAHD